MLSSEQGLGERRPGPHPTSQGLSQLSLPGPQVGYQEMTVRVPALVRRFQGYGVRSGDGREVNTRIRSKGSLRDLQWKLCWDTERWSQTLRRGALQKDKRQQSQVATREILSVVVGKEVRCSPGRAAQETVTSPTVAVLRS